MNTELKQKIKSEIQQIVDEIEFEEYQFNHIFHSNVEFQRAYYKFIPIYEKYGKEAYLRYVPAKYKNQELKQLIKAGDFAKIYERYGSQTVKKLSYTYNLTMSEYRTNSRFKLLLIKIKKLFSGKFISLPCQTILALPPSIDEKNKAVSA